jgi:hypothetical protein
MFKPKVLFKTLLFLRSVFPLGGIEEVECRPRASPGPDADGPRRPVRPGLLPGRPRWTGGPCRKGLSHAKNCQRHHRAHRAARSRKKGNVAGESNIACAFFLAWYFRFRKQWTHINCRKINITVLV